MSTRSDYREVETIRDPDGVVIIITERIASGNFSFRIIKEFAKEGQVKQTAFCNRRHLDAIMRLAPKVADRLDILEDVQKVKKIVSKNS